MKKIIFSIVLFIIVYSSIANAQGFAAPGLQWNIPEIGIYDWKVYDDLHSVLDFNGDGNPDLVDSYDDLTGNVYTNGAQKYWKVYLNTTSGFSPTAIQWNIPEIGSYDYKVSDLFHQVVDFNGDGKPDLVDSYDDVGGNIFINGTQKYWKVYLNNGAGFSLAAINWNIPDIGSYDFQVYNLYHAVVDFDGDGKPDLIDSLDDFTSNIFINGNQKYWKVYLNTGVGFSSSAINWNIPEIGSYDWRVYDDVHSVIDFNGDGKPDLIDSLDDVTSNIYINGTQKYWKVYLSTGTGFSTSSVQWNMPEIGSYDWRVYDNFHSVIDFNGDRKPDLIDSFNDGTSNIFINGTQKYWKVFLNSGSGFSPTATQWNMPEIGSYDWRIYDNAHTVIDFNGDEKPDLIDSFDDVAGSIFQNGAQKYWRVYLNTAPDLANSTFGNQNSSLKVYPNPIRDILHISCEKEIATVSVYNVLGQEVISKTLAANTASLDVSNLESGTYFVKVSADNLVETVKMIKE